VNAVGYGVIASPRLRIKGSPVVDLPPFEDGSYEEGQAFHWDREATYDELCAYTTAAFGENTKRCSEEQWRKEWRECGGEDRPYIIRTD
jgi:hypothetical protein